MRCFLLAVHECLHDEAAVGVGVDGGRGGEGDGQEGGGDGVEEGVEFVGCEGVGHCGCFLRALFLVEWGGSVLKP